MENRKNGGKKLWSSDTFTINHNRRGPDGIAKFHGNGRPEMKVNTLWNDVQINDK